jgi:hypothetical protein
MLLRACWPSDRHTEFQRPILYNYPPELLAKCPHFATLVRQFMTRTGKAKYIDIQTR